MLESVTVKRFKNVKDATLKLSRVNVLVGTNNSGKSSFLQAIAFAVSAAQSALLHKGQTKGTLSVTLAPEQLIYAPMKDVMALASGGSLRQSEAHAIEVDFVSHQAAVTPVDSDNSSAATDADMEDGGEAEQQSEGEASETATVMYDDTVLTVSDEAQAASDADTGDLDPSLSTDASSAPLPPPLPATKIRVRRGKNSNLLIDVQRSHGDDTDFAGLSPPFCMYVPGLAGIPAVEPYRTPAALRKAAARGDSNSVLRNVLLALSGEGSAWSTFATNLGILFEDHSIAMNFDPDKDESIGANLVTPDGELPLDAAGTGFLQAVQILAYAARDTPPLLLLDEPDSHLHPDKQRALMGLLQTLAEKGKFQVIIATHSRHMIDALDENESLHWMSKGELMPSAQTDLVSVLTELGALDRGDLLRNGSIDAVVLSEDRNQKTIAPLMVASGFSSDRIQIWSYVTCTQIQRARLLAEFIAQHAPATQVIIHVDRDYLSDEAIEAKKKQFDAEKLTLFVTDGVDAESQYLNADHVAYVVGNISVSDAQALIDQARVAAEDDSLKRLARELIIRDTAAHAGDRHHVPDVMALAAEAQRLLAADPKRWTYGKKALGVLTGLLQPGRGNIKLMQSSPYVVHPQLAGVASKMTQN